MAQTLTVKPEYVNTAQVFLSGKFILLNNNLTQEQLLAVWQKAEFRQFIDITYTNVADSFPENFEIDPNLFHAYDSGEVTHDPAKTNYLPNTLGKHLNDTRGKIDAFDNAFLRPSNRPIVVFDFANARFLDPRWGFVRNSRATYIDRNGFMREAKVNQPRFTYDPMTGESLGLLMEDQRTNFIPDSMYVNNWERSNANYNGASTILGWPAHSFTLISATSSYVRKTITVTPGTTYSYSYLSTISSSAFIRLGGTNRTVSTTPENIAPNVWLHSVTFTPVAGETSVTLHVGRIDTLDSTFIVTAPQLEAGAFYTSYIPTTNATYTREKDNCQIIGNTFAEMFPSFKRGTIVVGARRTKTVWGQYLSFQGSTSTNGVNLIEAVSNSGVNQGFASFSIKVDGSSVASANTANLPLDFIMGLAFETNNTIGAIEGVLSGRDTQCEIPTIDKLYIGGVSSPNVPIKFMAVWAYPLSENELKAVTTRGLLTGRGTPSIPSNSDLGGAAYLHPNAILRSKSRQEFSVDGTGASLTRNIRRDYDFTFEIVDSSGVTLTAQPASSCIAGTDNALTFTAPTGKTLTYAITPVYEN